MRRPRPLRIPIVAAALLAGTLWPSFAAADTAVTNFFHLDVASFTWKEFLPDGMKAVEESGPLYGLGWKGEVLFPRTAVLRGRIDLSFGEVDYDGHAQIIGSPALIPLETDTSYFFINFQADAGYPIGDARSYVAPFIGIGLLSWLREIDDSVAIDNGVLIPVSGAEENWTSIYAKLGLHGRHVISPQTVLYGEAGMLYPLFTENQVDILGDLTLEPKGRLSAFAEVGASYRWLRVALFYEGLRYAKSDVETVLTGISAFQPKSESDVFGLRVGVVLTPIPAVAAP